MILIIDKSKKEREAIQDMLYYMGVLSYPATLNEAPNEISERYSAVIISSATGIADIDAYIKTLKMRADIPIFTIGDIGAKGVDGVLPIGAHSSKIVEVIAKRLAEMGKKVIGIYRMAGIDASANLPTPTYLGEKIGCTKTEAMILRTLIQHYPTPLSPKELMKYSHRQSRMPEMPSVRTHISAMNKDFTAKFGRSLFESADGGYILKTREHITV